MGCLPTAPLHRLFVGKGRNGDENQLHFQIDASLVVSKLLEEVENMLLPCLRLHCKVKIRYRGLGEGWGALFGSFVPSERLEKSRFARESFDEHILDSEEVA